MKKRIFIFFIMMLMAFPVSLLAQDQLSKIKSDEVITINEKEYWVHQVKRGQTLYMISKAYGVDVKDIINENPEVKEGIQSGMKIRIPKKSETTLQKKQKNDTEPVKPVVPPVVTPPEEQEKEIIPCGQDKANMKDVYNIALMLPLYLNEVVAIDPSKITEEEAADLHSLQFLPFYEGFMMAADSLKSLGYRLKIYVYDVEKDTVKTRKILKNPEMKNMDLIIGLLYNRNFQIVADFAQKNSINIVNPISERDQVVLNNPYVIKVRPSLKSQPVKLVDYIRTNYRGANVVLVRNNTEKIGTLPDSVKAMLGAKNATGYADAITRLKKDSTNLILLYSDNKAFILDAITKFNEVRNEYPIVLVGLPRWDLIEGMENDYLVNLKTHIFAPFFIDYQNEDVKNFVGDYQEKYKTDPDPLAFQGFDVAMYFAAVLKSYGKQFSPCMNNLKMKSLQTHFEFQQTNPKNGFENIHWEIYMYDNYLLKPVD